MKILIVNNTVIPAMLYGGTERVIWGLGKELILLGHEVTYLVKSGSTCPFAQVIFIEEGKDILSQIPMDIDIVHFNFTPENIMNFSKSYLITIHGNSNDDKLLDRNTVFVSKNHAERYGSTSFVLNGLDWETYKKPNFSQSRDYFHFLGQAAWRVKNVKGAIAVIQNTKKEKLNVLGGVRFNFNMGIRLTFSPRVRFYGMVGGEKKDQLLNGSKGLIFPVRWHEPFGLAIIESLYFGCPVYSTPYGSLPELIREDVGFCSNKKEELSIAVENSKKFSPMTCHSYALNEFNSKKMALAYLEKYERVLSGEKLNNHQPKLIQIQKEKFLEWVE